MKSKYETHVLPRLEEIRAWARDGVIDKDIAGNLGIAYSTFRRYRDENEALSAALAQSKDYVDNVVVTNAYLNRIKGYDAVEIKREYKWNIDKETGEPKRELIKETEQTRHIPGDPRAAEFWLSNRQPHKWKRIVDAFKQEEKDNGGGVIFLSSVDQSKLKEGEERE